MFRRKTGLARYEIKDPLHVRVREALALLFICTWRGHDRQPGFDGGTKPCDRCSR